MKPLHALVIGGGPAGLFFAYLMKKGSRASRVEVIEQNPPEATFGFGVVLADRGLERLASVDGELHRDICAGLRVNQHQMIYLEGESVCVDRVGYGGAIARLDLLRILRQACERAGVVITFAKRAEPSIDWLEADLVVGADGVNSVVRSSDSAKFGSRTSSLTNHFAWYGTRARLPMAFLSFRTHGGGHFVAHGYPYSDDMGTLVAECDAATWMRLGMASMDDAARRSLIENIFVEELQGQPLVNNKSAWRVFPVIENEHFHVGNRVLIGDALHSAHFSIGSGTRIAMDDAQALHEAILTAADVGSALESYTLARKPVKAKLLDAARASYTWYENFPAKMACTDPLDFVYDFMRRTGRMTDERLRLEHPAFMWRYEHRRRVVQPARVSV